MRDAAMSPSTPPMVKASAAAGARLMEDVERALARVDPLSPSHLSASPSARRVVTALHGERGLAKLDLERRLVSRAACDALAELQRRLDNAQEETRNAIGERDRARAEKASVERDRINERREWLGNRDAVRREISLARDRVAAVKDEHKRNLLELDRERRRVKVACEETNAVKDELARVSDSNELLRKRLARCRQEIAKKSAEAAARDDAADFAFAANARNAAIAAREALKRADDDDLILPTAVSVSRRSPRGEGGGGDGDDEKRKKNDASAPPSPSPTTVAFSFDSSPARAALERDGSRADWARAYGHLVAELDAARARCTEAESALAAATVKKGDEDEETSDTKEGKKNETERDIYIASLVTRAEAAEALTSRLARLNAGLLDRLGEAVGAAPAARRDGEDVRLGEARVFFSANEDASPGTREVTTTAFEDVLEDVEKKQRHDEASEVTRQKKRDVLRLLESEVKSLDAEYRETIDKIARADHSVGGDFHRLSAIEVDALAARANALEDAIVSKVEEVQRLRDDVFKNRSGKIEL